MAWLLQLCLEGLCNVAPDTSPLSFLSLKGHPFSPHRINFPSSNLQGEAQQWEEITAFGKAKRPSAEPNCALKQTPGSLPGRR